MYATRSNNPATLAPCNPGIVVAQAAPKSGRQVVPPTLYSFINRLVSLISRRIFHMQYTHTHTHPYIKIYMGILYFTFGRRKDLTLWCP